MKTIRISKQNHVWHADYDSVRNTLNQAEWTFEGDYIVRAIEPPHCVNAYADLCESVNAVPWTDNPDFKMRYRPNLGTGKWLITSQIGNLMVGDYFP